MGKKIRVGKGTLFCLFEHFGLNEQVMCCFSPPPLSYPSHNNA